MVDFKSVLQQIRDTANKIIVKYPTVKSIFSMYTNDDLVEAYLKNEADHWAEYTTKVFPENIPPWTLPYITDLVNITLGNIPLVTYTIESLITDPKDIDRLFDLFNMAIKIIKKIEHDKKNGQ